MTDTRAEVIVAPDLPTLVEWAAKLVGESLSGPGRHAICLTGGSTPKPVYQRLASEPYRSEPRWDRVHWFWSDDRFVPQDDERNNAAMARSAFLDYLPIPPPCIHAIPTDTLDHHEAARRYENTLRHFYGSDRLDPGRPLFDLVLLGLGSDGHTASLFPGDPALQETNRWAVGIDKAGLAPFVPRVTLTFPALASTRQVVFLVSGKDKRDMVKHVLSGADLPAARARTSAPTLWMLDRAAAPDSYPLTSEPVFQRKT